MWEDDLAGADVPFRPFWAARGEWKIRAVPRSDQVRRRFRPHIGHERRLMKNVEQL
jgi:hypothetical protein